MYFLTPRQELWGLGIKVLMHSRRDQAYIESSSGSPDLVPFAFSHNTTLSLQQSWKLDKPQSQSHLLIHAYHWLLMAYNRR